MQPIEAVTPLNSLVWRIIHFPLVLLVVAIGLLFLGALASHFVGINGPLPHAPTGLAAVAVAALSAGLCVLVYWVFVRFVERRPRVDEFATAGWAKELGAGLLIGIMLFSAVVAVIAADGGYRVIGTHPASVLLPVLAISIVSGVTEEIILRGLFFRIMERWLGSWAALALSAALFGALHLGNRNATLLAGAAIALEAGIMLAALYMLTRRLWAAIGVHAAWNFAQGGIYGIAVSGLQMNGLLRPRIAGSDLLTGGAFGAEASLPAMVVATGFGIAVLVAAHRRGRFVAPSWVRHARVAVQPPGLQE